jgi:hypothetical protein
MMELVDMLGLGSSSFEKSRGSSPLFGKITNNAMFNCGKVNEPFNSIFTN